MLTAEPQRVYTRLIHPRDVHEVVDDNCNRQRQYHNASHYCTRSNKLSNCKKTPLFAFLALLQIT